MSNLNIQMHKPRNATSTYALTPMDRQIKRHKFVTGSHKSFNLPKELS